MKIKLKSILKNTTDNEDEHHTTIAEKEKNKIKYQINNDNHILKIISPKKIILYRSNKELECTMYFELNKTKASIYTFKKEQYTLEIDLITTYIEITHNRINIHYNVIDSNTNYEYQIEMSEYNEYKKRIN